LRILGGGFSGRRFSGAGLFLRGLFLTEALGRFGLLSGSLPDS
jgi:hypothetical protein